MAEDMPVKYFVGLLDHIDDGTAMEPRIQGGDENDPSSQGMWVWAATSFEWALKWAVQRLVNGVDGVGIDVYEVDLDGATLAEDPNYPGRHSVVSRSGRFVHKVASFATLSEAQAELDRMEDAER